MKEEFLTHLLGSQSIAWWAAALIWTFIGAIVSLYLYVEKNRDKNSPNTPYKYNFWFMLRDNLQRLTVGLFVALLALRFSVEIFGTEPTIYLGVLYGIGSDKLAQLISNIELTARPK